MQATSDKTASANFTQTGGTSSPIRGIANNLSNGKTGYNPFFQWGRKDVFRSAEYTEEPGVGKDVIYVDKSVTVGETIQNPTTHYQTTDNSIYYCYVPLYYNAWNATYTTYSAETTSSPELDSVVKTIYDPCPVGYTVPPANTFTAFNTTNMPVDGSGRLYAINGKTLYFPFAGRRGWNTAATTAVGVIGYYHASVFGTNTYIRVMFMAAAGLYPCSIQDGHGIVTSSGNSVRPVREN